jgi:hypothetical protein
MNIALLRMSESDPSFVCTERALDSDMENVVSYSTIYTNMIAYNCVFTVKYAEGIIRLLSERKEPFGILMEEINNM